ncbi:sugar phosphate isomerase/epimerase family protein [Paenibacillus mendelii]|uniref:Sugar phosphate isomerase/epimerase family protein n=1 Tax=Paenibacillus mendelii TaxID=206163 RepID=A0ABV6J9B4_9BACL|nr:sugar phosphate isomerase/epimerase [Paenibacillus mendelii]MCQ6559799.1 sugar phosphate isomerase/epimerase [Paenibacillus mendelii]
MRRMGIGLQLYTLRDETAVDFAGTLRKVAELGYEGVEFAGYGGLSATEMQELLKETGLKAVGSHVGLDRLRADLQGEIDYLKAIGGRYIICPWVSETERDRVEDWEKHIEFWKHVGAEVRKQGLTFAYHNHDFEFHLQLNGEYVFDAIYSASAPEEIQVEMDVCWVQFAGQDPIAYIQKYAGRLPLLHLKDFNKDLNGQMVTLELGQGVVQLKDVIAAASEANVEWLLVEQDNCQNPPLQSVANSLNWVRQNYLTLL